MNSCIYEGRVHHRRIEPQHVFTYGLFTMYLDLDELPHLFDRRWLWSYEKPNLASFHRRDYLGDPDQPLADAVRDSVARHGAERPAGPIRLLTQLRYFGYGFNPVSFYFCFDRDDRHVEAIVAEVTNTPWNERHAYVLQVPPERRGQKRQRFESAKEFHVSPYMAMDMTYDWSFAMPGAELVIHIGNRAGGRRVFDATMSLRRREITAASLARVLGRYPLMTARITGAIYMQALRLWMKNAPFVPHPRYLEEHAPAPTRADLASGARLWRQ